MPTIDQIAGTIISSSSPVLLLDTCSILDVIRAPIRNFAQIINSAKKIVEATKTQPVRCTIVLASLIPTEWKDNRVAVISELEKHLKKHDADSAMLQSACAQAQVALDFPKTNFYGSNLPMVLDSLSRQLIISASIINSDPLIETVAFRRAVDKRRPGRAGGEVKDCAIFEEYLGFAKAMRSGGSAVPIIFCTSNTNDYCENRSVHPDVESDCKAVGITFTKDLPWAVAELKI